jgi:electron transport complex protein RnfG
MRQYLNMVLTLFITTVLASLILSCVYRATKPRIEATQQRLMEQSLGEVMSADRFVPVVPETLYQAVQGNETVGIVFRVFPQGYGGRIPILVGLTNTSTVTGIRVASASEGLRETPGLGSKVTDPDFEGQFADRPLEMLQLRIDGGVIDAVTGATISSRAVTEGVRQGAQRYQQYLVRPDLRLEIFPAAAKFEIVAAESAWFAYDSAGTLLGLVGQSSAVGYCGPIQILVGLGPGGRVIGVRVIAQHETEGIGTRCAESEFLDQFARSARYETISGATISSRAVIDAVAAAVKKYQPLLRRR